MTEKKRKTTTHWTVKRRYNDKHYKRLSVDMKFEDFDRFDRLKGDKSRPEFIVELLDMYERK